MRYCSWNKSPLLRAPVPQLNVSLDRTPLSTRLCNLKEGGTLTGISSPWAIGSRLHAIMSTFPMTQSLFDEGSGSRIPHRIFGQIQIV